MAEPKNMAPFTNPVIRGSFRAAPKKPAVVARPSVAAPPSDYQVATQQVQTNYVDPLLTAIKNLETARSTQGQNAISGYTQAEQQLLANQSPLAAAAYGSAMQGQNAIDQAIASRLQGQGDQNAADLGSRLSAISADPGTAGRLNTQAAQTATGGANAAYASHSATLSALNQEGAATRANLAAQPGIAGLAGLQASQGLQGQINQDQQTRLDNVTSQVPQLVQGALSQIQNARANQASQQLAVAKYNEQVANDRLTADIKREGMLQNQIIADNAQGFKQQALKDTQAYRKSQIQVGEDRIAAQEQVAQQRIAGQQQAAQTRANATITAAQTRANAAKGVKGASQSQVQSFLKGLKTPNYATVSKLNSDGSRVSQKVQQGVTYNMNFTQAYKRLRAMGVDDLTARTDLQTLYPRGVQGRAWLTNEEQTALKKAQTKVAGPGANVTSVHKYQGHAFLTMPQAKILNQAGLLPKGEQGAVNGTPVWYINPDA